MKKLLAFVLLTIMVLSLPACSGKEKESTVDSEEKESTVVGTWEYIDDESWTLGFTEDGDFYDSRGEIMTTTYNGYFCNTQYGSWRIRADGKIWLTGTITPWNSWETGDITCEWSCSYELDGDTLRFSGKTFVRVE